MGNITCNLKITSAPNKPRTARALNLKELPDKSEILVQLWKRKIPSHKQMKSHN
ncbi:hypothetical protein SynSYN20_01037 [Synechococcus sp. SYN20]|nr:hypothetical protein SynSYN20_01037 [Synechococcus sp. SYN20]